MITKRRIVANILFKNVSSTALPEAVHVPNPDIDLLIARRVYEVGIEGFFDDKSFFRSGNQVMIYTKTNKVYISSAM